LFAPKKLEFFAKQNLIEWLEKSFRSNFVKLEIRVVIDIDLHEIGTGL